MHDLDHFEAGDDGTVFRDVILLALMGFVTLVVLLLPHINPPAKAVATTEPPGNVIVEVRWPDPLDADVDLWVEAPKDRAVGYSNQSSDIFNLLRDDLGHHRDTTGLNYEVAYSRGVPPGGYTVNLHLYRNQSGQAAIPARVVVKIKRDPDSSAREIASKDVTLHTVGKETTVVRFDIDDSGHLVPGSIHDVPRKIRVAEKR